MTHVYYKYAIAAVVVFDLTRPATFDAVIKWKDDLDSKVVLNNQQPVPCVLLANKCDRPDSKIDRDQLDTFCQDHGFVGWFATSAAENISVGQASSLLFLFSLFFFLLWLELLKLLFSFFFFFFFAGWLLASLWG